MVLAKNEIRRHKRLSFSLYGSVISWWLYDAPDAGKNKEFAYIELPSGFRYTLETPEQLYDYLTGENNGNTKRDSV